MKKKIVPSLALIAVAVSLVPATLFAQPAQGQANARALINQATQRAGQQATSVSDMAAQIKNKSENTSLTVRKEVCEQKKVKLQTATRTMYQGAASVKGNLDKMYDRIVTFYENDQLTVPNFEQQIQKIELTRQLTINHMQTLQARETPEVDCADVKTASRLEGDRLAGQEVKSALKQYRTELVDLISSMRSASATEETDNE